MNRRNVWAAYSDKRIKEAYDFAEEYKQFLNISGVKGNYDCGSTGDLVEAVSTDISIKYFPSVNEKGEVVAKAAELKKDADNPDDPDNADYSVTFVEHDDETGEEVLKIQGEGRYRGSCELRVRMNSAFAKTPPARINGLVYNEKSQKLIEPGEAENGTMLYAVCDPETKPVDGDYKVDIPEGTNAGKYDIWYKVIGDGRTHSDMPAQKLIIPNLASAHIKDRPVRIVPRDIEESGKIKLSKTAFTYNGKVQKPSIKATGLKEGTDYIVVKWDNSSSKKVGTYGVNITGTGNYDGDFWLRYTIKKAANPMTLKARTATVKRSKVKKKAQTIKRAKAFTVSKAKGKLTHYAKKLIRWERYGKIAKDEAAARMARRINHYFYGDGTTEHQLSWREFFFRVITRPDSLHELDLVCQDLLRKVATGKLGNARYRCRYDDLRALGYRPLVHEYYRYRKEHGII